MANILRRAHKHAALAILLASTSLAGFAATKGPDSGGYTGTDSTVYSFVDVSASGVRLFFMKRPRRLRSESIAEDDMLTHVFNMILHKHRPNLALLHVIAVDHTQHNDGPRSEGAYTRARRR